MATVTETLSVSKIYAYDYVTESESLVTASTVSVSNAVRTEYASIYELTSGKSLRFESGIENSENAAKRKLSSAALNVYVSSKSASGSGSLPAGKFTGIAGLAVGTDAGKNASLQEYQTPWENYITDAAYNSFPLSSLHYGSLSEQLYVWAALTQNMYTNVIYTASASLTIQTVSGTNAPTVTAVWEDIAPSISSMYPASGAFVNEQEAVTFGWMYSAGKTFSGTSATQASAVFKWRLTGDTTEHSTTISGDAASLTLPAGTIPSSSTSIDWCVTATTVFGVSTTSNWITCSTVDVTPCAPTDLSPSNSVISGSVDNIFSWVHNITTGSAQSAAELQVSYDSGTTWTALASVSGSAENVTISAGAITAGSVQWRVRTSNSDGTAGAWSAAASVIVRSAPAAPTISSCTKTPRPTVKWQSTGQIGYRVVFTDSSGAIYDTGERYGSISAMRCWGYLADGAATITVYIGNEFDLWSSVTVTLQVANIAEPEIPLWAAASHAAVSLGWGTPGTFDSYYVLRDGIPICKTSGTTYVDKASAGTVSYQILGAVGDYYSLSAAFKATVSVKSIALYDVENDGEMLYLYTNKGSPPVISKTSTQAIEYNHFYGEQYPASTDSGNTDEAISMQFTVLPAQAPVIAALAGKLVCIKDMDGNAYFARVDAIKQNLWRRTDIELSCTRVSYSEEVAYD